MKTKIHMARLYSCTIILEREAQNRARTADRTTHVKSTSRRVPMNYPGVPGTITSRLENTMAKKLTNQHVSVTARRVKIDVSISRGLKCAHLDVYE